jgi:hypothetical protein
MATTLPRQVIEAMAERPMRMHHALWHISRNGWATFSSAQQAVFRAHGWEPPRPARKADGQPEFDNASGEDFLFMHRQMIAEVNEILAGVGDPQHPRVEGWPSIPAPGDADFPVPPAFAIPGSADLTASIQNAKTEQTFNRLHDLEQQFTDPTILQTLTLGRLGAGIEFTVHNTMHLRWSGEMPEYRLGGDPFNVDAHFDEPSYNWLADFYSSHVNPIFWKLHGWVDARIDDWMRANQRTGPVPWTVTPWVGPMPPGHEHHTMARHTLRAPADKTEADALRGQIDDLEAMIDDAKATGTREPTPFVTIDWSPRDSCLPATTRPPRSGSPASSG